MVYWPYMVSIDVILLLLLVWCNVHNELHHKYVSFSLTGIVN